MAAYNRAALRRVVLALAARIKDRVKPWPEKPAVYEMAGFRLTVDKTPLKGFRRVVITDPQTPGLRVTLVDANPAKVRDASTKVMVYFAFGPGPERVGQVRLAPDREPELVWFAEGSYDPTSVPSFVEGQEYIYRHSWYGPVTLVYLGQAENGDHRFHITDARLVANIGCGSVMVFRSWELELPSVRRRFQLPE